MSINIDGGGGGGGGNSYGKTLKLICQSLLYQYYTTWIFMAGPFSRVGCPHSLCAKDRWSTSNPW